MTNPNTSNLPSPVYIICHHCSNDMPQAATGTFHNCLYCGILIKEDDFDNTGSTRDYLKSKGK